MQDCTAVSLKAGDVTGSNIFGDNFNDNIIGLDDMTAFLSAWTAINAVVTETNIKYDFDSNGFINFDDATALLSSWCDFYCEGAKW